MECCIFWAADRVYQPAYFFGAVECFNMFQCTSCFSVDHYISLYIIIHHYVIKLYIIKYHYIILF